LLIDLTTPHLSLAQTADTVRLGILFVQFADSNTNVDARGGCGWIDTDNDHKPDTLINDKYTYMDFWNIFFQEQDSVHHPDFESHSWYIDHDKLLLANHLDLYINGSFRRYWKDVSYDLLEIVPGKTRGNESGIINKIDYCCGDSSNGKIRWLTLSENKSFFSLASVVRDSALALLKSANSPIDDYVDTAFSQIIVVYAGSCVGSGEANPGVTHVMYTHMSLKHTHFSGLAALCHEFAHDALAWKDLHDKPNKTWVGHFSLMGDPRPIGCLTPPHPDPMYKLMAGWLKDSIVYGVIGDIDLPIIEEKYNGGRPFVLVLPVRGSFQKPFDWYWPTNEYYIIENRRATGFDRYINRYSAGCDSSYGAVEGNGGFVIWEHTSRTPRLRIVEADDRYQLTTLPDSVNHTGAPSDFFSDRLFAPWTFPNDYTRVADGGYPYTEYRGTTQTRGWPVLAKFSPYNTTSNVNTVSLVSTGGRFSDTCAATANNNQRKLAWRGSQVAMVNEAGGRAFLSMSTNNGLTWDWCELLSSVNFNSTVHSIPELASAPSVCWMEDTLRVVWQQKDSTDKWRIAVYGAGSGARVIEANIDEGEAPPTPVIGYGMGDQGEMVAKVVYSTSAGLKQSISTNKGVSWLPPDTIAGTDGFCIHPSLAMNQYHSMLVYEDLYTKDLYYSLDGGSVQNLTYPMRVHGLTNHRNPSVILKDSIVHVVWVADLKSLIGRVSDITQRAIHVQMNVDSIPSSAVKTFFDRRNGRTEYAEVPVLAPYPSGPQSKGATILWSVADSVAQGVRLRHNRYVYNTKTHEYNWLFDYESPLSSVTTRHPAITEIGNDARFIVTRENASPYQLVSHRISEDLSTGIGDRTIDIGITTTDLPESDCVMSLRSSQPLLMSGSTVLAALDNAGVPDDGFDGSGKGPGVSELLRTESTLFEMTQSVAWSIRLRFDSLYNRSDTIAITGRILDPQNYSVFGSSNTALIPENVFDTTVTLGFELPPSLYPEAEVVFTMELENAPDSKPDRFLSVMHHIYSEDAVPKRMSPEVVASKAALPSAQLFPNPATGERAFLRYTTTAQEYVRVELFDALGRLVRVLKNGPVVRQDNLLAFSTEELNPGRYIVRITTGGKSESLRFNVVK
jgi:hypothetical protein